MFINKRALKAMPTSGWDLYSEGCACWLNPVIRLRQDRSRLPKDFTPLFRNISKVLTVLTNRLPSIGQVPPQTPHLGTLGQISPDFVSDWTVGRYAPHTYLLYYE